ncbi:diuretic hormone 45 [Achroia grisella]|uniref:diuretic hormone 45 n=1 Tax=Achroia grisella TaxID=688607 RepID=UPI0027D2009A|nr:diuretic hormone 45 [Achroia grisella]
MTSPSNEEELGFIQRLSELNEGHARAKRKMPSLSINNPMEVLRQRLLLEVARKQMREANQRQAVANRLFLQNVGKRGFWAKTASSRYDN